MNIKFAGWGTYKDAEGNVYSDDGSGEGYLMSQSTGELFCISKRDENENPEEIIPLSLYEENIAAIMRENKCSRAQAEQIFAKEGFDG